MRPALVRRAVAGTLLGLASTVFSLGAFEMALRVAGFSAPVWSQADAELGWRLRAGLEARHREEGDALVRVNAAGWRDREHALEKPPGVYRIAVLGDSYAEARQVSLDKAFWTRLPEELERCGFQPQRRIEVLNFGVSGYGTAQEMLVLEQHASRYRPDLVLLQFTNGNDVRNNSKALEPGVPRPYFALEGGELRLDRSFAESAKFGRRASPSAALLRELTDRSRVLQLVRLVRERGRAPRTPQPAAGVEQGLDATVLMAPQDANWEGAWRLTEVLIVRMRESAERHGAAFVLVTVPYAIQVHPSAQARAAFERKLGVPDLFYPDRRLDEFARREGIVAVTLAPQMQRIAERTGEHLHGFANSGMGRGHWNERGHRVAAQLIAQRLCAASTAPPAGRLVSANR